MAVIILGVAVTQAKLKRFQKKLMGKIEKVLVSTSEKVAEDFKTNVRVDTGKLRNSAHVKYQGHNQTYQYKDNEGKPFSGTLHYRPKTTDTKFGIVVGTNAPHAAKIEGMDGTLYSAFEKSKDTIVPALKAEID